VALGRISVGALAGQSFAAPAAANGESGSAHVANGFTELSQQGESQTLDLQFGATGTVSGSARLATGNPAANHYHCLELRSTAEGVAFRRLSVGAYADSDGHYQFADVSPGPVSILLRNCEGSPNPGYAAGVVQAGANLEVDVTLGNAATLPVSLSDSVSGASAEVQVIGGPSFYDPYLFALPPLLTLDDRPYPGQLAAISRQNGRELELPALSLAGLRITRRYYVPASGGYVRVLESFGNASAAGIAVPFRLAGRFADPAPALTVSSPPGRWWLQTAPGSGDAIAYVLSGTPAGIPNALDFADGQRRFGWGFDLDIAAAATERYLYYLVPRTNDAAAAAVQAEALGQGTEPGMFDGLSAEERAEIQNFEVPAP